MNINLIVNFFTVITEVTTMFMLYDTFCKKRENFNFLIYTLGYVILTLLVSISNYAFDYSILNFLGMVFSFFVISFFYKCSIKTRAVISVLNFLINSVLEIMVLYGIILFLNVSVETAVNVMEYRILGIIASKTFTFIIVEMIRLKFIKKQILFQPSYWILFFTMFLTSVIAVFLIFKLSYEINEGYMYNLSMLCSLGLLFSTFFALYLYEKLAVQAEVIYNQKKHEQNLKEQIKHIDDIMISQKQLKKFKHDFTNYMLGLKGFITSGDYIRAESYINELCLDFAHSNNIIETGNVALDAVLTTKKAMADSKNIKFSLKVQLPEKISVDDMDLCSIFGNALDNAIEACERILNGKKEINVSVFCQNKMIFCKISNTAVPFENKMYKTSKSDKINHGFGLENITNVLEKYNTKPEIECSNGIFTLKFIMFF